VSPRSTQRRTSSDRSVGPYSVRISDAADDPNWDDFLEHAPNSVYTQTSCWGRVRATVGWRPVRVVLSGSDGIVAGAQIVTRPLPMGGNVGLVSHGPVISEHHSDLLALVFDEMLALGRANDVQYLVVLPPQGGDWMSGELLQRGFRHSLYDIGYTATILMDLRPDLDGLLAKMTKKRRQNIRSAERRGVTIRRGSQADLPIFNRLKDAHSTRLGYARRSEDYYAELWRALAPREHIALFIAEYEGEPLSAQLVIPFGDTCHHMERPWSGEHGELNSNELLEWHAIKWAKSRGYLFVDHEAIETPVAEAVLSGREVPPDPRYTATLFKLKWGGQVVLTPPSFDYVYNPVLRFGFRRIPNRVLRSQWMDRRIRKIRRV
jgi:peptidoglycan pentaglycine glycine transferase (the first glycine)